MSNNVSSCVIKHAVRVHSKLKFSSEKKRISKNIKYAMKNDDPCSDISINEIDVNDHIIFITILITKQRSLCLLTVPVVTSVLIT
jgi:hypothetical protein